ncbi:MAG: LuxR C-terminal-related transcriptional regulator [Terrimicrobiaceae bacterium]
MVTVLMAGLQKLHGAVSLAHLAEMATLLIGQFVPVRLEFLAREERRVVMEAVHRDGLPLNREQRDMVELLRPHLEGMARVHVPGQRLGRCPQRLMAMGLTAREAEVLHWVEEGKTSEEVGVILILRSRTVDNYVTSIMAKLKVETRLAAAAEVRRWDEGAGTG